MAGADGYVLLGHGPLATGSVAGWRMSESLYARCPRCQDFLSLAPSPSATCSCGVLFKDSDAGRFGCTLGDESIAVYRRL